MKLCQISDLHIKTPGKLAYGRVDTAAALARCVARIQTLDPAPDAILITGDLVDFGQEAEYRHLRHLLAPILASAQPPVYLMVGNHDHRDMLRQVFPDLAYLPPQTEGPFLQYRVDLGPCWLIALDTQDPPGEAGRFCATRQAWLQDSLAAAAREADKPVVLAMHHPPFPTGIAHMDAIGLPPADRLALATLLRAHPQVTRILCGHLHRSIHTLFAGTLASTCPSPAHQVAFDLRPDGPSAFRLEPPGFQIHTWEATSDQDGLLVSHDVSVEDYPGPYPFFDGEGGLIDG